MSNDGCAILLEFSRDVVYHLVIATKGFLCSAGAVGIIIQWKKQGVRFLGHDNSKIMFNFYYFLHVMTTLMFASLYFFEIIRLRFDCVLIDFRLIIITKGIAICAVFSSNHIILILSVERVYSSVFPAHFEKNSNRVLAYFLAISAVLLTSFYTLMCLTNNLQLFYKHYVPFLDERLPENAQTFSNLMKFMTFSCVFSIVMLCVDIYLNFFRRRVDNTSLAVSYQFAENRRVILILLPIELTGTILSLITVVALALYEYAFPSASPIGRQLFLELVTFPPIYALLLSFFLECRVGRIKRNSLRVSQNEVDHFESLRRAWDGPRN